uniref:E3 ubiquitin-protein ligase n=1 Tax=Romanomermis culicivorax TaxID=13658 RepID=A0A915J6I3_ROMCU
IVGPPYQTILFNDESHSYDDVIATLCRSLNVAEDKATFLASVVDREGRTTVRSGENDDCEQIRDSIATLSTIQGTKAALKVESMSSCLISHQQCAIKLLSWLVKLGQNFGPILQILNEFFIESGENLSLVEFCLAKDSTLWKSARTAIHQFILGTVLLDLETKKKFARIFMRNYGILASHFAKDDHEHSISIISLTVQLFTVPTI